MAIKQNSLRLGLKNGINKPPRKEAADSPKPPSSLMVREIQSIIKKLKTGSFRPAAEALRGGSGLDSGQ